MIRRLVGIRPAGWRRDLLALAVVGAIAWGAIAPVAVPWLPLTHDWGFHLSRTAGLLAAWEAGVWYPRWLPDAGLGAGLPVLNYYSPLGYFLAGAAAVAARSLPIGLNLAMAVALIASAVAFYGFARATTGDRWAAVVGAAVYLYAPYHLVDAYRRGALPETLALAWLPAILLGCWLCVRSARRTGPLCLAGGLAGLVLTHNLTAAFFLPIAILYAACLVAGRSGPTGRSGPGGSRDGWSGAARRLLAGAAIGAGLSAPFWLPALAEASAVQIGSFTPPGFRPRDNLVLLADLVQSRGWVFDYADDRQVLRLGVAQAAIVAAAALVWLLRRRPGGRIAWLAPALIAASLLLMTEAARPIWESAPALAYLQFSWRLLGPAALGTAWLVALAIAGGRRWRYAAGALIVAGLGAAALPGLRVDYLALAPRPPSRLDLLRRDAGGIVDGKLPDAEFQPRWRAQADPGAGQGGGAAGIDHVRLEEKDETRWVFTVEASRPGRVAIPQAFFPGWQASIDGRPAEVVPTPEGGLAAVDVPAGSHRIEVRFGETPPRILGWVLGAATLALAGWWLLRPLVSEGPVPGVGSVRRPTLAGAAALVLMAGVFGWDRTFRLSRATVAAATVINEEMAPGRDLLALGRPDRLEGGLSIELLWAQSDRPGSADPIRFRLADSAGREVVDARPDPVGSVPAAPGSIGRADYLVPLPADLAPGTYRLMISVDAGERTVTRPIDVAAAPAGPPRVPTGREVKATFGDAVALDRAGWGVSRIGWIDWDRTFRRAERLDQPPAWQGVDPGSWLLIELDWRSLRRLPDNYHVFVHLIGPDGRAVAQNDTQPASQFAPTSTWRPGDRIADRHRLRIPPDLAPGLYDLRVGLYRLGSLERLPVGSDGATSISIGTIKVGAPPPPPPATTRQAADFEDVLRLTGTDPPERRGDRLVVATEWTALRPIEDEYTLFAHLVDQAGRLVAQWDGPPSPGGAAYPTTFWAPGERVRQTTEIALPPALPPGGYRILVGAYRTADVRRLTLADGRDAFDLGAVDLAVVGR